MGRDTAGAAAGLPAAVRYVLEPPAAPAAGSGLGLGLGLCIKLHEEAVLQIIDACAGAAWPGAVSLTFDADGGGKLTAGPSEYAVKWQSEKNTEFYSRDSSASPSSRDSAQLRFVGPTKVVGKVSLPRELDQSTRDVVKSRIEQASKKRRAETVDVSNQHFSSDRDQPKESKDGATKKARSQSNHAPPIHSADTSADHPAVAHKSTHTLTTNWIRIPNLPLSICRASIIEFLQGIEEHCEGVFIGGLHKDKEQELIDVFVQFTATNKAADKFIPAGLSLQRQGEDIRIPGHWRVSATVDPVHVQHLPWVTALTVAFPDDRTPASALIAAWRFSIPAFALLLPPLETAAGWLACKKYIEGNMDASTFRQARSSLPQFLADSADDKKLTSFSTLIELLSAVADRVMVTGQPILSNLHNRQPSKECLSSLPSLARHMYKLHSFLYERMRELHVAHCKPKLAKRTR